MLRLARFYKNNILDSLWCCHSNDINHLVRVNNEEEDVAGLVVESA